MVLGAGSLEMDGAFLLLSFGTLNKLDPVSEFPWPSFRNGVWRGVNNTKKTIKALKDERQRGRGNSMRVRGQSGSY